MVHGLYSWIPLRPNKILSFAALLLILKASLTFLNTYPGLPPARNHSSADALSHKGLERLSRAGRARPRSDSVVADGQTQSSAYEMFLREVNERFKTKSHGAVFHDDLAEINAGVFFISSPVMQRNMACSFCQRQISQRVRTITFQPVSSSCSTWPKQIGLAESSILIF